MVEISKSKYNTFVPRFCALVLDVILLLPLSVLVDALSAGTEMSESARIGIAAIANVTNVLYFITLHALFGQTVGKYLMKVKVVDLSEGPIAVRQAIVRDLPTLILVFLALIPVMNSSLGGPPEAPLTPAMLLISVWMIADIAVFLVNEKRRALHDLIAGTVVIRTEEISNREH